MKKTLLALCCIAGVGFANAATLPEPTIKVLPSQYDWFDAFAVVWAENITEPYQLEIVDSSKVSVFKNETENIRDINVALTEYQLDEDTPNYPDTQLVVTLLMLETDLGSTYSLLVEEGAVNVTLPDGTVLPNDLVEYSFTLTTQGSFELPAPVITPESGQVEYLDEINVYWPGTLKGLYDGLNYNVVYGTDSNGERYPESEPDPITVVYNGETSINPEVNFIWSSDQARTSGWDGDIMVISLGQRYSDPGTYVVTIPAGYLRVTDVDEGTLENEEIILSYTIGTSTGVEMTGVDSEKTLNIFNLQGMKVSGASDLKSLPKGIYIINGKKVAL